MHQLVRLVGLAELLLSDARAQVGGDVVADVLDLVGPAVGPDGLQTVPDLVGAPLDALTDELLARVDAVLKLAQPGVDQIPEPHQPPLPPCCACC